LISEFGGAGRTKAPPNSREIPVIPRLGSLLVFGIRLRKSPSPATASPVCSKFTPTPPSAPGYGAEPCDGCAWESRPLTGRLPAIHPPGVRHERPAHCRTRDGDERAGRHGALQGAATSHLPAPHA
jgi:hypothetical protein